MHFRIFFAPVFLLAATATADDVALRASIRLPSDVSGITLADIAELTGPEAERFASLVIRETVNPSRAEEISISEVRTKLVEAGAHFGRLNLSGARVTIRPRRATDAQAPVAMQPVALPGHEISARAESRAVESATPQLDAAAILHEPTLRGLITQAIVDGLKVKAVDLRLAFSSRDEALLNTSASAARFEITPLSAWHSDRLELSIRRWNDATIERTDSITVAAVVRVRVPVAAEELDRQQLLTPAQVTIQEKFLPPGQAALVAGDADVVGHLTIRRFKAGDTIRASDIRSETIVRKGDRVLVRCLVGGVVITLQAEARDEGARGQQIEFRKLGERETFLATITGPNEAVLDLGMLRSEHHAVRGDGKERLAERTSLSPLP